MRAVALVLLFVCAALSLDNPCQDNSYANKAVASIRASSTSFSGLTTASEINSALKALADIALGTSSAFLQNIYIAQANNDTYLIKNCLTQESTNTFCGSTTQYLAYVRNTVYFNDNVRHVFAFSSSSAIDVNGAQVGAETADYIPSTRVWFNTTGWNYNTYATGGSGYTYSVGNPSSAVAATDRPNNEFCGECLSNSYAITVSQAIAINDLSSYKAITGTLSSTIFQGIAQLILSALTTVNSTSSINSYVGFSNDNSYLVKDCGNSVNSGSVSQCSGNDYLLYVTNSAVLGQQNRTVFKLNGDGSIDVSPVLIQTAYYPTQRQWYQIARGWSDPYTFASSSTVGSTYSAPLNGGVVGTDRTETEPCTRAVATTCPTTTTSVNPVATTSGSGSASSSSASSVFASIAMLMLVAFFML